MLSTSALNCSQGSKIKRLFSPLFKNGDDSHKKLAWEVKSMTECDDWDFLNLGANFTARTPPPQLRLRTELQIENEIEIELEIEKVRSTRSWCTLCKAVPRTMKYEN